MSTGDKKEYDGGHFKKTDTSKHTGRDFGTTGSEAKFASRKSFGEDEKARLTAFEERLDSDEFKGKDDDDFWLELLIAAGCQQHGDKCRKVAMDIFTMMDIKIITSSTGILRLPNVHDSRRKIARIVFRIAEFI